MHYSYDELLRLTRYLTGSQKQCNEQFQRMIFNLVDERNQMIWITLKNGALHLQWIKMEFKVFPFIYEQIHHTHKKVY